jgi:hypothetical protein
LRRLRLRRPSPALIVSSIALLVALGGTSYAAFKLPKKSVGTTQLKANAVTGAKVKDHSLTDKDIVLSTLGQGSSPQAATPTAPPLEAIHLVGTPGQPPFEAGAKNFPAEMKAGLNFQPVGFYKDPEGIVHLEGVAVAGNEGTPILEGPIFTLPAGFRPGNGLTQVFGEERVFVFGSNVTIEGNNVSGRVIGKKEEAVILDGVTFRAGS